MVKPTIFMEHMKGKLEGELLLRPIPVDKGNS
jgi:hypothetical protein